MQRKFVKYYLKQSFQMKLLSKYMLEPSNSVAWFSFKGLLSARILGGVTLLEGVCHVRMGFDVSNTHAIPS